MSNQTTQSIVLSRASWFHKSGKHEIVEIKKHDPTTSVKYAVDYTSMIGGYKPY